MNKLLICRLLGLISLLIGASMLMSLPWAFPLLDQTEQVEWRSVGGLVGSMAVCLALGSLLMWIGRTAAGAELLRREAIAIVGLSWIMAMILGALPFWLSGTAWARAEDGRPLTMNVADGLFESASGFSGTGATVLTNLEDPELVPRAILFWRSQTHFLGGLGIMVLFVAVLGMGSAGKALMLAEMPGPSQESAHERTQHAAWVFATIFIVLTAVLTVILIVQNMSVFDALCHAFGTIATGGFSTHNKSVEFFQSAGIDMTIALFMFLACINFTLLYYVALRRPGHLLADIEFRTYAAITVVVSLLIVGFGMAYGDFPSLGAALRQGVFQVVSIITNTGFGTANFDHWNSFSRAVLFLLMFIGGCAGSTSCSMKVIRHVLFFKILWLEMEKIFHPSVVRHVRLGGHVLPDPELRKDVLVYFAVILLLFIVSWMMLVALEPDSTWVEANRSTHDKLIDCASAVAATLNGVGPGLGIVGEAENYSHFHWPGKLILTALMLLGRLEVFVLVVLFVPRFWRTH